MSSKHAEEFIRLPLSNDGALSNMIGKLRIAQSGVAVFRRNEAVRKAPVSSLEISQPNRRKPVLLVLLQSGSDVFRPLFYPSGIMNSRKKD